MIFRGAIYEIKTLPGTQGHEQSGKRYGIIIQSDLFATSTITLALTSTKAGPAIYRPEIEFHGVATRILTDQIFSVTQDRLGKFVGSLEADEFIDLDRALMLKLGLI